MVDYRDNAHLTRTVDGRTSARDEPFLGLLDVCGRVTGRTPTTAKHGVLVVALVPYGQPTRCCSWPCDSSKKITAKCKSSSFLLYQNLSARARCRACLQARRLAVAHRQALLAARPENLGSGGCAMRVSKQAMSASVHMQPPYLDGDGKRPPRFVTRHN